jgi:Glycosyl hydrolase family 26
MDSLLGQVFATMARMSETGKYSRYTKMRSRRAQWRRPALTVLLVAAAGCFSYVYLPGTAAAAVADRFDPALAGLLGQGGIDSGAQLPAPIVTATARTPQAGPTQSSQPTAPSTASPTATSTATSTASPTASPTSPAATTGTSSADAAGLGIYDGEFGPAGIETAADWLGSPDTIKYAEDFIDATDWSHISDPWQLPNWKGSPYTMVWSVPMLPCGSPSTQCATNVSDFNQVADGGADSYYKTLAQNLVSTGFGASYIRLGWEFNGTWMGWSICNQQGSGLASWASDFVPAFQNIVTSMRSVAGANFKFIWNPDDSSNVSCPGANLANFYPGDNYVNMVALDVYDGIGTATSSDAARWSDLLNGVNAGDWTSVTPAAISGQQFEGYGLNWLTAFAKEHDKELGLPEWGLFSSSTDDGGGDDPYFMTKMADWIKANATGPAIFWNFGDGTMPLDIPDYTTGDTPDATAAFKAAFDTVNWTTLTPTGTLTPSTTPTGTPAPSTAPTGTPAPSPTKTGAPVPSPTQPGTPAPSPTKAVTPAPSPTKTVAPAPSPTKTVTPAPSPTKAVTPAPSPTRTGTPAPSTAQR